MMHCMCVHTHIEKAFFLQFIILNMYYSELAYIINCLFTIKVIKEPCNTYSWWQTSIWNVINNGLRAYQQKMFLNNIKEYITQGNLNAEHKHATLIWLGNYWNNILVDTSVQITLINNTFKAVPSSKRHENLLKDFSDETGIEKFSQRV